MSRHLRETCSDGSFRPWVADFLGMALVDLVRPGWAVLANDILNDPLMRGERIETLLLDPGAISAAFSRMSPVIRS